MATARFYSQFFRSLMSKEINLTSDTVKLMVCNDTYTPNQDTHRYKSDLIGEVSGPGYTAGGVPVNPMAIAYDAPTNVLSFDGADANFPNSTITGRWGVLYVSTPATDATRPLIGYVDFGGNMSSVAANFGVIWAASGIGAVTIQ